MFWIPPTEVHSAGGDRVNVDFDQNRAQDQAASDPESYGRHPRTVGRVFRRGGVLSGNSTSSTVRAGCSGATLNPSKGDQGARRTVPWPRPCHLRALPSRRSPDFFTESAEPPSLNDQNYGWFVSALSLVTMTDVRRKTRSQRDGCRSLTVFKPIGFAANVQVVVAVGTRHSERISMLCQSSAFHRSDIGAKEHATGSKRVKENSG